MRRIILVGHVTAPQPKNGHCDFYGKVCAQTYLTLLNLGIQSVEDFKRYNRDGLWNHIYAHVENLPELVDFLRKVGVEPPASYLFHKAFLNGKLSRELYEWLVGYKSVEDMVEEGSYISVCELTCEEQEELECFVQDNGYPKARLGYKRGAGAVIFVNAG